MTADRAALIEARRQARLAVEVALRRQGLKPQHIAHRVILGMADEHLATHRDELITEASTRVERLGLRLSH
jgi:hypothetical protein